MDSGVENYPYIYFATPITYYNRTLCLSSCPTGSESTLKCVPNSVVTSCTVTNPFSSINSLSTSALQTSIFSYETAPYFGRICLPSS